MNGTILGRNPAAVLAVIQAALTVAVTFGLHLTVEQVGALLTFSGLLLALVANNVTTSTATPTLAQGTTVQVVTPKGQADQQVTL